MGMPQLRRISMHEASNQFECETRLSLAAVVSFAVHCPELQELGLFMAIAKVNFDILPAKGALDPPRRRMTHLYLQKSPLIGTAQPMDVTRFLLVLFQRGTMTGSRYWRKPDPANNMWAKVGECLQVASEDPHRFEASP
jgi:hypothetical protein